MRTAPLAWRPEDTVEALLARYRAEKDPELKPRWQALWLLRRDKPRSEVADALGIDQRTLREWVAWYRRGGCMAVAEHRRGAQGGVAPRLTPEQHMQIKECAGQGKLRGIAKARDWVQREFGIRYTYWGMRSVLDRLRIHARVPRPLGVKADLAVQDAWKKGGYVGR